MASNTTILVLPPHVTFRTKKFKIYCSTLSRLVPVDTWQITPKGGAVTDQATYSFYFRKWVIATWKWYNKRPTRMTYGLFNCTNSTEIKAFLNHTDCNSYFAWLFKQKVSGMHHWPPRHVESAHWRGEAERYSHKWHSQLRLHQLLCTYSQLHQSCEFPTQHYIQMNQYHASAFEHTLK